MWLFRAVSDANLGSIIKVDLQSDRFNYAIDDDALTRADGIARYKSLADIERGFRVLKSEIKIAPVFRRRPIASVPTP